MNNAIKRMKKFKRGPAWITRGYHRVIKPIRIYIDPDMKIDLHRPYVEVLQFKIDFNEERR